MTAMALAMFLRNNVAAISPPPPVDPPVDPTGGTLPHGEAVVIIDKSGWSNVSTSPSNLQSAINSAGTGGTIITVSNGTISGSISMIGKQNICIRAANRLQVTVSGTWEVQGGSQNIEFDGLRITGQINTARSSGTARRLVFVRCLLDSNPGTLLRNTGDPKVLLYPGTRHVRFGYCEIDGNGYAGRWAIYQRCRSSTDDPKYVHIHDCLINNTSGSPLRIGDTSFVDRNVDAETVIEYCHFVNNFNPASDGTLENELIVGKASRGWVRYCTFQGVGTDRSSLSLRHGRRWTVHDNVMFNSGGIIGGGTEHRIYNNLLVDCVYNFRIFAGMYDWESPGSQNPPPSIYGNSKRGVWAYNTVVLTAKADEAFNVGFMWSGEFSTRVRAPATDNDFVGNLVHRTSGSGVPFRRNSNSTFETGNRFAANLSNVGGSSGGTNVTVGTTALSQTAGGVWKIGPGSAAIGAGPVITNYGAATGNPKLTITTDSQGELRGSSFDIGCDEYSTANVPFLGLRGASDVGVNAPERSFA